MPATRYEIEEVPRPSDKAARPVPASVSRIALHRSSVWVDTGGSKSQIRFSVVPNDQALENIDGVEEREEKLLCMEMGHYLLKRIFRGKPIKEKTVGEAEVAIVNPVPGELAQPELVVKEQPRVLLGTEGDYAFMGDGQSMGIEGEPDAVIEFVNQNPDRFPLAV
jgi:hypothetical protein